MIQENLPQLGEIRRAKQIGYKGGSEYIWHRCIGCGKERWVELGKGEVRSPRCNSCAAKLRSKLRRGPKSSNWKGGRVIANSGYIDVKLQPEDFFFPMAGANNYVKEHRLIVAKALGRNLHSWEIVHHRHAKYPAGSIEDKQDNRYPENLQLVTDDRHKQISLLEAKVNKLLVGQRELKKELRLLRFENKQLKKTRF